MVFFSLFSLLHAVEWDGSRAERHEKATARGALQTARGKLEQNYGWTPYKQPDVARRYQQGQSVALFCVTCFCCIWKTWYGSMSRILMDKLTGTSVI